LKRGEKDDSHRSKGEESKGGNRADLKKRKEEGRNYVRRQLQRKKGSLPKKGRKLPTTNEPPRTSSFQKVKLGWKEPFRSELSRRGGWWKGGGTRNNRRVRLPVNGGGV